MSRPRASWLTQALALLLYGLINATRIAGGAWFGPVRWPGLARQGA